MKPQTFAPNDSLIEAIFFDGSSLTALEVATWAGTIASISVKDGKTELRLARRLVPANYWIVKRGTRFHSLEKSAFDTGFIQIGNVELTPAVSSLGKPPRNPNEIEEDDIVTVNDQPDAGECEVVEIIDGKLTIDTAFGEITVSPEEVTLVRKS